MLFGGHAANKEVGNVAGSRCRAAKIGLICSVFMVMVIRASEFTLYFCVCVCVLGGVQFYIF